MKADGVFEGGGVKGIALVGALAAAEDYGYDDWQRVAGTSAGAIIAALLASGYSSWEIKGLMLELDYSDLVDHNSFWDLFSHPIDILKGIMFEYGINSSQGIREWLEEKLRAKNVKTFGDLRTGSDKERYRYRLRVIASDISDRNILVLPQEIEKYGRRPDELPVAEAVEMSILFPGYFRPKRLGENYVIDGGILSNFPVWLFDCDGVPRFPTFGFQLLERKEPITGPMSFAREILYTMLEGHDNEHQEDSNLVRSVSIPSTGVSTLSFNLSQDNRETLYESGNRAAREFFSTWDFDSYKKKFRS